jgi:GH25 family lysozyme M1 (1,4-beta-N-acetylmuramidase)
MKGIDISAWQERIDWPVVRAAGVEFVIVKMGQGGRVDSQYYNHVSNALNAGMKVGVYIYSVATDTAAAEAEADFVHAQLNGLTPEMGIWFDAEDDRMTGSDITAICAAFVNRLQGYAMATSAFIRVQLAYEWLIDPAALGCPIWCAQYNSECNYTGRICTLAVFDAWNIAGQNSTAIFYGVLR